MPEVIDLVSSTPPPPKDRSQQPSSTTATHLNPPVSAQSNSRLFSSDDFDSSLFAFDDEFDKPAKRRRLSDQSPPKQQNASAQLSKSSLFLFSDEDVIFPSTPKGSLEVKKTSTTWKGEESDPIVFTSSAPRPEKKVSVSHRTTGYKTLATITIDDDDDSNGGRSEGGNGRDDIEEFSDQLHLPDLDELLDLSGSGEPTTSHLLSSKTASLLASLESRPKTGTGAAGRSRKGKDRNERLPDVDLSDDLIEPKRPPRKPSSKPTTAEKEAKAKERAAAKVQRERERELEKERKQKLKEEKAREKQLAADIAEANKLKVDKKDSTPEMIIDMASSLEGSSVGNQSTEFMKRLGVQHTFFPSPIDNVVKWRRKTTAVFNENLGYWEPCPLFIQKEQHVLCWLSAQQFVDMVLASPDSVNGTDSLELHVLRIKSAYPGCKPIYIIEGLTAWMRKNRNSRNRAYQAEVRRQMEQANDDVSSTQSNRKSRKKKPETTPPVDDDTIEDALLQLQVTHACLIHHTNAAPESAEWIKNFTEHISTIPYRRERMESNDSAFCMDTGQVKTGDNKADTFVKMLQEVNRVTASMAYGIVARYPSVTDLIRGMRVHGPSMLEDVKVCLFLPCHYIYICYHSV